MKSVFRRRALSLSMVILCICAGNLSAHVQLDYPQGSEVFYGGQNINIQWTNTIPHDTQNWDLYISVNAGETWSPLALDIPVDVTHYVWNVPYIESPETKIRVVQDNNNDVDYFDTCMIFTITVHPQEGPLFEIPAQDLTLQCNTANQDALIDEWLTDHGGAVATGTCGELTWTHNYTGITNSCGATGTALVTFSVSDGCGGNLTTARVTISDSTPPTIVKPAGFMTVQCDGEGNSAVLNAWLDNHGGAIATDQCGEVDWTNDYMGLITNCGMAGSVIVNFVASDQCGNTSLTNGQFTIVDTSPPVITAEARDTLIDCTGMDPGTQIQNWLDIHGGAVASDQCDEVSWTYDLTDIPADCNSNYQSVVHFTAIDGCGNSTTSSALVSLNNAVSVQSLPGLHQVLAYPNPVSEVLHLIFPRGQSPYTIMLSDILGSPVMIVHGAGSEVSLPVSEFTPGIYILQVRSNEISFGRSIVIE